MDKRGFAVLIVLVLGLLIYGGVHVYTSPTRVVKDYLKNYEEKSQLEPELYSELYPEDIVSFLSYSQENNLPEPSIKIEELDPYSKDKVELIARFSIFTYGPNGIPIGIHDGVLLFSLVKDKWQWHIDNIRVLNEMRLNTEGRLAIIGQESEETPEGYSFIKRYGGMKYPGPSGLREYIGEEPLRIYPSAKAPYVYEDWNPQYVEIINQVRTQNEDGTEEGTFCLVLDMTRGISGYTNSANLKEIDPEEGNYIKGDGKAIESLGGFKVGDRIETLIGLLDRDYYLMYENGRIYGFPDNQSKDLSIDPKERPFSDIRTLDAFTGYNNNYVVHLRTDSPEFPLKTGYKVGDNAMNVLNYYSSKYRPLGEGNTIYGYPEKHVFVLNDESVVGFRIDTEELKEDSIVTSIQLVKLKE